MTDEEAEEIINALINAKKHAHEIQNPYMRKVIEDLIKSTEQLLHMDNE